MKWRGFVENVLIRLVASIQIVVFRMRFGRRAFAPSDEALESVPILIVRREAKIGSNLPYSPFLCALRSAYPGRRIHLFHHAAVPNMSLRRPCVDKCSRFTWRISAPGTLLHRLCLYAAVFRGRMSRACYLFVLVHWPLLARISGAQRIVAFSRRKLPERAGRNIGTSLRSTDTVCNASAQRESRRALRPSVHRPHARPGVSSNVDQLLFIDELLVNDPLHPRAAEPTSMLALGGEVEQYADFGCPRVLPSTFFMPGMPYAVLLFLVLAFDGMMSRLRLRPREPAGLSSLAGLAVND